MRMLYLLFSRAQKENSMGYDKKKSEYIALMPLFSVDYARDIKAPTDAVYIAAISINNFTLTCMKAALAFFALPEKSIPYGLMNRTASIRVPRFDKEDLLYLNRTPLPHASNAPDDTGVDWATGFEDQMKKVAVLQQVASAKPFFGISGRALVTMNDINLVMMKKNGLEEIQAAHVAAKEGMEKWGIPSFAFLGYEIFYCMKEEVKERDPAIRFFFKEEGGTSTARSCDFTMADLHHLVNLYP